MQQQDFDEERKTQHDDHPSHSSHRNRCWGGWSGIASAWYLHLAGFRVHLYDRGRTLGGRSASGTVGGKTVTFGGKNIGTKYHLFREFVRQVEGGAFEHFGLNSHNNGWEVTRDPDNQYWLIPPTSIDPEQTPIPMPTKSQALHDLQHEQASA